MHLLSVFETLVIQSALLYFKSHTVNVCHTPDSVLVGTLIIGQKIMTLNNDSTLSNISYTLNGTPAYLHPYLSCHSYKVGKEFLEKSL